MFVKAQCDDDGEGGGVVQVQGEVKVPSRLINTKTDIQFREPVHLETWHRPFEKNILCLTRARTHTEQHVGTEGGEDGKSGMAAVEVVEGGDGHDEGGAGESGGSEGGEDCHENGERLGK